MTTSSHTMDKHVGATSPTAQPLEILLAEDEDADILYTQLAFYRSTFSNNLTIVRDGVEVIEHLNDPSKPRPQLIFLDINMPRKNGLEVLKEIKSNPEFSAIPVIILTTSESEEDAQYAMQNHASAFVPKAMNFDNMVEFIENIEKFWFKTAKLPKS